MRTLSLSVVPALVGCNAECKFCISGATFAPKETKCIEMCVLDRACLYARNCGALTGIVTGKGEPLLIYSTLLFNTIHVLSNAFGQVDLHSNGVRLLKDRKGMLLESFINSGLTNLTISVAHYDSKKNTEVMGLNRPYLDELMKHLKKHRGNLHIRLSCVLAKGYIDTPEEMLRFLDFAKKNKVDSVIFRELWVAGEDSPQKIWCQKHWVPLKNVRIVDYNEDGPIYNRRYDDGDAEDGVWDEFVSKYVGNPLMRLPWSGVYDWNGISVTASECEYQEVDFVKSLILLPDNHLYYSWSSPASRLW